MLKVIIEKYNWQASEASETLSGVTQRKIRDNYLFIYMWTYVILYFDPRIFVLASWSTLPIPTLNRIFSLVIVYHSRKFNCLPLCITLFLNATRFP